MKLDSRWRRAGQIIMKGIKMRGATRDLVTIKSLENAAAVVAATGGSTNAGVAFAGDCT